MIGWVYERLFNPQTYYRYDTAMMFQESVRRAVNEVIDHAPVVSSVAVGRAVVARALLVGLDRAVRDLRTRLG